MIPALLDFVHLLRKNGIRCATAEVLDAVRALETVGLGDPTNVRAALGGTLIKRLADQPVFEELFDLFFFRPREFAAQAGRAPLLAALEARGFSQDEIEALLAILADEATRMGPLARAGMGLSHPQLARLVRLAGLGGALDPMVSRLQVGFFSLRLQEAMGFSQAESELTGLHPQLARKLGEARAAQVLAALLEVFEKMRRSVRDYVDAEWERQAAERTRMAESLLDKPFGALSPEEIARLSEEVRRLARKLRTQASLRPHVRRRGRLDLGRTLRRSLASGGVPFVLRWRYRRREKPRLVILCDISDSVRHVSRFMLQFTYTLQDLFSRVRSFVFVSEIGETTALFSQNDIERATELASSGAVINVFANSNFGRAFWQFRERHLDAVDGKTTVIVIGDGRNNYHPAHAACLADVRRRAKRVLWLNPEPRENWAFGDSAMREYEPHCNRVEVVYSLASLSRVLDGLVL